MAWLYAVNQDVKPPFVVIASGDSPSELRKHADYVCLSDNCEQLINAVLSSSKSVALCPGTYRVSDTVLLPSNSSVVCSGQCVIKPIDSYPDKPIIANADSNGNDNIVLIGLVVDGANIPKYNIYGISMVKTSNALISGVKVASCYGAGIRIKQSSKIEIRASKMEKNHFTGVFLEDANSEIIIHGCLFKENNVYGIYADGLSNSAIYGNVFLYNVKGIEGAFASCVIAENVIMECEEDGIVIYDMAENLVISGNTVKNTNRHGIQVCDASFTSISNNVVRYAGMDGINVCYSSHCSVVGNVVVGSSRAQHNAWSGIRLSYTNYSSVSGNTVRKGDLPNKPKYGIEISSGSVGNMVEGNNLYDSGVTGDLLDSGTATRRRDNVGNAGGWLADA